MASSFVQGAKARIVARMSVRRRQLAQGSRLAARHNPAIRFQARQFPVTFSPYENARTEFRALA